MGGSGAREQVAKSGIARMVSRRMGLPHGRDGTRSGLHGSHVASEDEWPPPRSLHLRSRRRHRRLSRSSCNRHCDAKEFRRPQEVNYSLHCRPRRPRLQPFHWLCLSSQSTYTPPHFPLHPLRQHSHRRVDARLGLLSRPSHPLPRHRLDLTPHVHVRRLSDVLLGGVLICPSVGIFPEIYESTLLRSRLVAHASCSCLMMGGPIFG